MFSMGKAPTLRANTPISDRKALTHLLITSRDMKRAPSPEKGEAMAPASLALAGRMTIPITTTKGPSCW